MNVAYMCSRERGSKKKKSHTEPNPEMVSMEEVAKKKNLTPNLTRKWLVWKRLLKKKSDTKPNPEMVSMEEVAKKKSDTKPNRT